MRLVIDTDAGVDDSQAIMMALAHPGVTVEAITTVTGNVHVDQVVQNIFTILEIMHGDAPVYYGADQPLVPGYWQAEHRIHGEDGLGNYSPRPATRRRVEAEPAALALVQRAKAAPGELTLVALGPLTNVALAVRLDPSFARNIKQFVFMGGAVSAFGNAPSITAEFNIYSDPEAALIALSAFPAATMLSWEATLHHPFSWEQYDALAHIDTDAARFFAATTRQQNEFLRSFRQLRGFLLPDPLAMAITLDPGLIRRSEQHYVTVELQGQHTRGQTVVDYMCALGCEPNVEVVHDVDTAGVYELYRRMLS